MLRERVDDCHRAVDRVADGALHHLARPDQSHLTITDSKISCHGDTIVLSVECAFPKLETTATTRREWRYCLLLHRTIFHLGCHGDEPRFQLLHHSTGFHFIAYYSCSACSPRQRCGPSFITPMSIFGGCVQDECFITKLGSGDVSIDLAAEPSPNISTLRPAIKSLRTRQPDDSCKIKSSCTSLAAASKRGLANAPRHITISITAPPGTVEQDLLIIDVGPDMTIADLKAVVQSDTNVPTTTQAIYHNGRELRDERQTLEQCQVKQDDMLEMLVRGPQSHAAQAQRPGQGEASASAQDARGQRARPPTTGNDPEMLRLRALGDVETLAQLRTQAPPLADAVSDPTRFRQAWETIQQQAQEREDAKQREYALLNEDPFNVEAQAKIEEMIREQQVAENLQTALDYNPEGRFFT